MQGFPKLTWQNQIFRKREGGKKRTKGVFSIFSCSSAAAESLRYSSQPASEARLHPAMYAYTFIYLFELA